VPDSLIGRLQPDALPEGWQTNLTTTQQIGNNWLASRNGGLLVPSVVAPASMNCLLNPSVPEIQALSVQVVGRFPFDKRLRLSRP
jgi:RES domain-containing protein